MTDHATNVLYPKIKRAMGLLEQMPAGESAILDEAYNAEITGRASGPG